jgi:transcriptional regulator with XRE-family HTH domain
MTDVASAIPFGTRLLSLLEQREPPLTQAWLADKAGLDRSLISRIVRGERSPTSEALQCLAPALGVEPAELVRGTDAEARLQEANHAIQQADYALAIQKIVEYESQKRELENQLNGLKETLAQEEKRRKSAEIVACEAHLERERAQRDLQSAHDSLHRQEQDLRRYQSGLSRAIAEVTSLRTQIRELGEELASTKKSSRAATILAGVAAVTGVATVAHFLSNNDDDPAQDS